MYLPSIKMALHYSWLAIESDSILSRRFPSPPTIYFSNHGNLKTILTHTTLCNHHSQSELPTAPFNALKFNSIHNYNSLCNQSHYLVCPNLTPHSCITSQSNKFIFPIDISITCFTLYIIYSLSCKLCGKQYIDHTKNTRYYFAQHLLALKYGNSAILYTHFCKFHHTNSFQVEIFLSKLSDSDIGPALQVAVWKEKINTYFPSRLNNKNFLHDSTLIYFNLALITFPYQFSCSCFNSYVYVPIHVSMF